MQITFGTQIIKSYKRLSYTPWYALAEFIDNSTESYLSNKEKLDKALGDKPMRVDINYDTARGKIEIMDNAMGMSKDELHNAFIVGQTPKVTTGRSQYGLGMKTAACWLGNKWTVRTKKLGENVEHFIEIDVEAIAKNNTDLHYKSRQGVSDAEHYTIIEIFDLNQRFYGKTQAKIKSFLTSMYRRDFKKYNFKLYWDGKSLEWDYEKMIFGRLHKNRNGEIMRRKFEFAVGEDEDEKFVRGWVGVFEQGSRKDAGFSIIQADRVIKGYPDPYRPESVFGENRNDLINQRLVGEIFLKGFSVSHTKDEILFENDEQEEFESKLAKECADYRKFASEYRKYLDDERMLTPNRSDKALNEFEVELTSPFLRDKLKISRVPPTSSIREINSNLVTAVVKRMDASLKATIDELDISIYVDSKLSPNDPYVLVEVSNRKNEVIVIINSAHPHWTYLSSSSDILNFIRHSTYDGVAEWKAMSKLDRIDSDTIKYIKDDLLRVPFQIESRE